MDNISIAQKYFEVSNKSDMKEISGIIVKSVWLKEELFGII